MLDLRTLKEYEFFELTWVDGTILKIGLIPQKYINLFISESHADKTELELINESNNLVLIILNNNKNGIKFTLEQIEEVLNAKMINKIILSYNEYMLKELGKL